jgi:hypothetical protein
MEKNEMRCCLVEHFVEKAGIERLHSVKCTFHWRYILILFITAWYDVWKVQKQGRSLTE